MSWFVISLDYVVPVEQIDQAMKAHVAFLETHQLARTFIAWGRKVPRTGGIILATGSERAAIEKIMLDDPFIARGLATFTVTEFAPKPAAIVDGVLGLL